MIEKALVAQLLADATVSGIVGNRPPFPEPAPQDPNSFPRITYDIQTHQQQMTMSGPSGFAKAVVTVACQTMDDPATLDTLTQAVINLFDGAKGTFGGVKVQASFYEDDSLRHEKYTVPEWGPDSVVLENEVDITFWFETV